MKLLHIRLQGWTATFRLPLLYTGTGLTAPVPPYSTLLGLMGSVAGREIHFGETRIGYEFRSEGVALDLEKTERLQMNTTTRRLRPQPERGIAKRQFHVRPQLDLYLDNLDFRTAFEEPQNPPCLGRSQDVAWITTVEEVDAEPVTEGIVRGTLIPFPEPSAGGVILRLPEYFDNADTGYTRRVGKLGMYQVIKFDTPALVQRARLVHVEGQTEEHAIYLHILGLPQKDFDHELSLLPRPLG
jgi:CRISPR-associated protein Cas5t